MKTMIKMINRFNWMNKPNYSASYNFWESHRGYHKIWITRHDVNTGDLISEYTFTSAKEFREWMDGVVLD